MLLAKLAAEEASRYKSELLANMNHELSLVDKAVKFTPERGNISISIVKIVESEIGKGSIFTVSIPVEQTTSFQSKAY